MVSSIGKFGSKAKDTFHNIKTGAKRYDKSKEAIKLKMGHHG